MKQKQKRLERLEHNTPTASNFVYIQGKPIPANAPPAIIVLPPKDKAPRRGPGSVRLLSRHRVP